MNWESIETAPRDGQHLVCWREGWEAPLILRWKMNHRTNLCYFGDPNESDDYELFDTEAATHWHPLSEVPK